MRIYADKDGTIEVDGTLIEGQEYLLDLSDYSPDEKIRWVREERLENFISFHPKNNLASIKFINVVGYVNLFGKHFDVRSAKLQDGLSGDEQFKSLLQDIVTISNKLSFTHTGTAATNRIVDQQSYDPTDLERFDYFYQLTFSFPTGKDFASLVNQVFSNPNSISCLYNERTEISKSKRITSSAIRDIGKLQNFASIKVNHPLAQSVFGKRINERTGKSLYPTHLDNAKKKESFDTVENRFVKFLLEDIKTICLRLKQSISDNIILGRVVRLEKQVDFYLQQPFFRMVGRLSYIPTSSSVLLKKAGYRELYFHYVQSKFGFYSVKDELTNISMKAGLKDIATLYELWVYFKMGECLFGENIIREEFSGKSIEHGNVVKGIAWSVGDIELGYNVHYNRSNHGSYSVHLRPDISLKVGNVLYLFDAKYKYGIRNVNETDELQGYIKAEDIHKMHAYLDAIPQAQFSLAIYPGTEFILYDKNRGVIRVSEDLGEFKGVGAIPLSPVLGTQTLLNFLEKLVTS